MIRCDTSPTTNGLSKAIETAVDTLAEEFLSLLDVLSTVAQGVKSIPPRRSFSSFPPEVLHILLKDKQGLKPLGEYRTPRKEEMQLANIFLRSSDVSKGLWDTL